MGFGFCFFIRGGFLILRPPELSETLVLFPLETKFISTLLFLKLLEQGHRILEIFLGLPRRVLDRPVNPFNKIEKSIYVI